MDLKLWVECPDKYYDAWRLLVILWRGMNWNIWGKYRRTIWQTFTNTVRSVARTTGTLELWLSRFTVAMQITNLGTNVDDRLELKRILTQGNQALILRQFREEAPFLVLLLRRFRDIRREELEQRLEEEYGEDIRRDQD